MQPYLVTGNISVVLARLPPRLLPAALTAAAISWQAVAVITSATTTDSSYDSLTGALQSAGGLRRC